MKLRLISFLLSLASLASAQQKMQLTVSNPLKSDRHDQPVVLSLKDYPATRSALVTVDGKEIPCQLDDLDLDETYDELCFLVDLKGKEQKNYSITLFTDGEPRPYPARVYAEMLIRNDKVKEKNKHNNFVESLTARGDCANSYNLLHHHGVDFESELNGIRIYFDKRQTLDLYGKYHRRLELQATQFYTSPLQKAQGYGDDILWVGNTFGLGAFRGWDGTRSTMVDPVKSRTQRVIAYGPLRTIVEVIDRGWKVDAQKPAVNMTLRFTQYASHRDTGIDVTFDRDVSTYHFSTGIIDVKGSMEYSDHKGLRGCWGTDYPASDTINWKRETVGLGICIPRENLHQEIDANRDRTLQGGDYTYVLSIPGRTMHYDVAYCSDNETFGFHTSAEWFAWLQQWKREIQNPVRTELRR